MALHLTQSYCFLSSLQCAWKTESIQFSVRLIQVSSFLSLFFSCILALTCKVFSCLSYWNSSQGLANACKFVLGEGSVYICYLQICFFLLEFNFPSHLTLLFTAATFDPPPLRQPHQIYLSKYVCLAMSVLEMLFIFKLADRQCEWFAHKMFNQDNC